jgi:hypothetical protein
MFCKTQIYNTSNNTQDNLQCTKWKIIHKMKCNTIQKTQIFYTKFKNVIICTKKSIKTEKTFKNENEKVLRVEPYCGKKTHI